MTVSSVDQDLERLSLYAGAQIVAEVAVHRNGTVQEGVNFEKLAVPYGNRMAYGPAMLVGFGLLFVLMAGVAPLRRMRNLDVLAALSLVAPIVLLRYRYVDASVLAAVPGVLYLMARCAWIGLVARRTVLESTPLFEHLTSGWQASERVRILRLLVLTLALVFAMVGISSSGAVDVIYGVMEGATNLIHGVLPYGHMPGDVIHGDTYPILSYAFYAPLASLSSVTSTWDSVDIALAFTVVAALAVGGVAWRVTAGPRPARQRRSATAESAGLRAALTWLTFPPVLITVSTGTTDVVLAALLLFAVALWRRPGLSSALLAIAGWFKLAPFVLVPLWLAPHRGRRLVAAIAALAGVSLAVLSMLVALGGAPGAIAMLHALSFQFSRGSPQSVWTVLGIGFVQPVGEGAVLALVAAAAIRIRREPDLASDRMRIAAVAAAVLLGLQLAADYWAFLYVSWVVPLLAVSLLSDAVPAAVPESSPAWATARSRLAPVGG